MKYIVSLNGKNYEVEVEKSEAKLISVSDAPVAAPVAAPAAPAAAPAVPAASATAASADAVPCPMPGTVFGIKKNVGDAVKKGEAVMVLEAMKMENDIPAPKDGVVKAIYVKKDQTVSTGDPLFLIG